MSRKVVAILQIMFIFTLFSLFAFSVQAADKKKTDRTFKIEKVRKQSTHLFFPPILPIGCPMSINN